MDRNIPQFTIFVRGDVAGWLQYKNMSRNSVVLSLTWKVDKWLPHMSLLEELFKHAYKGAGSWQMDGETYMGHDITIEVQGDIINPLGFLASQGRKIEKTCERLLPEHRERQMAEEELAETWEQMDEYPGPTWDEVLARTVAGVGLEGY